MVERSMLRRTHVMDISSAMARGNRHQQKADLAVFKFITVSLPKRLSYSHMVPVFIRSINTGTFTNNIIVFRGGDDGRGDRYMCKIPRGSHLKQGDWHLLNKSAYR